MGDKKRLFIGVQLALATTRKVGDAIEVMRRGAPDKGLRAVWVPPPNLHLTLKFLGWVRADAVAAIGDALAQRAPGNRPFDVQARGVGAFPNERAARVLWVGAQDPSGSLAKLVAEVEDDMAALGFPREERAFSPHLTIGRVKEGKGAEEVLAPYHAADFGRSTIRELILFESVTKSTGSVYMPLARATLGVAAAGTERQTRVLEPAADINSEEPEGHGGQQPA